MRAWHIIARLSRPALAVAALYAFVLGSFLGALTTSPLAAASAHVLCTPSDAHSSDPAVPDPGHRACCTAACLGGFTFLPPGSSAAPALPRTLVRAGWLPRATSAAPAGPEADPRVRGPPLA